MDESFSYTRQIIPATETYFIVPAVVAYVGPGDVVSGAAAWWGLRAYSSAKVGTKAIRLIRASDSAQQDFNTLTNGALDIASISTFLTSTTGKVVTLYDQTGNGFDITQSTDANRPDFLLNQLNGLPIITFATASSQYLTYQGGAFSLTPQPISWFILCQTLGADSNKYMMSCPGSAVAMIYGSIIQIFLAAPANSASNNNMTSGNYHSVLGVFNSASSLISIDAVNDLTVNPGTNAVSADNIYLGCFNGALAFSTMDFLECGMWSGDQRSLRSAMNTNEVNYWGPY